MGVERKTAGIGLLLRPCAMAWLIGEPLVQVIAP